jgi:glycosyltransferase involved in cell wall biosynthesis
MSRNILHVVNISFVLPYFIGNQFNYFHDKGYKLFVVCSPSEHLRNYANEMNFDYCETPIVRNFSLIKDIESIFKIIYYIKKNKIDIVCGHTPKGSLLSMIAALLSGVKKRIYFRHGLMYETSTGFKKSILINIERFTSYLATDIVCVSQSVLNNSIKNKLSRINKCKLLFKGSCNGVDVLSKFNPENIVLDQKVALKRQLYIPNDVLIIGYTGRLVKDKGIIDLVNAWNIVKNKINNVILLLVGPFEERDALSMSVIDTIKTSESIIWTGLVDGFMEYYYSLMDIFILPSYREGFPTSILEASSMCLPVITTRVTGCIDSIIESETGIFVDNSALSIANGIIKYCENHHLRKKHGYNGRNFIKSNFEQSMIWDEIENKLYKY